MEEFRSIDTWVFDLDNTLYPRHCDLFSQIDVKMTGFLCSLTGLDPLEARKLQKQLYRDFGTTLRGLMETRDVDPHEFLNMVHDIDYSPLPKNEPLGEMLQELPGRKLIYTNGSVEHAKNTLAAMNVDHNIFESIFDIVASDFVPKPHAEPFDKFLADHGVDASRSAMFEDLHRNLEPAKANGMVTVLITPQGEVASRIEAWESTDEDHPHVDHKTDDLDKFLTNVLATIAA